MDIDEVSSKKNFNAVKSYIENIIPVFYQSDLKIDE